MSAHLAPYVGIVVSQEHLDVDVDGAFWHARNDEFDIQATIDRLTEVQPALVVVEAAGGFEWPLLSELYASRIPVALVNPDQVREFAASLGLAIQVRELHVHWLASLGAVAKFRPCALPDEMVEQLSGLVTQRRQLAAVLAGERYHRLKIPLGLRPPVEERIDELEQRLNRLSDQIQALRQPFIEPAIAAATDALARASQSNASAFHATHPWRKPAHQVWRAACQHPLPFRTAIFAVLVLGMLGLAGFFLKQAFFPPPPPVMAGNVMDVAGSMSGFDKTEIHVKVGQPVTIRLTSTDNSTHTDGGGKHQWAVDELGVNIIVQPDSSNYVTFTPEKAGNFMFYCDVCCGGRANPSMNGTLVVES